MKSFKICKFIFLTLLFTLAISSSVYAYNDLDTNHWAYTAVSVMQERGILNGYPDGNFYPEQNVTREEFAKIVVNTLELTKYGAFLEYEDIEETRWSKQYIDIGGKYFTAYKQGDKYFFKPEEASLREDVIVTTVLALGMEDLEYDINTLNQFSDRDTITSSLKKYLAIAVENDLINGNPDGTINPQGNLTRAEVAQFMYNILVGLEMEEEEVEEEDLIKIPVFEEINQKTVDFYSAVSEVSMESTRDYVVGLENIDGEEVYQFINHEEGKNQWLSAEDLKGSFTVVTSNKNNEIDRFSDLDGNRFIVNYDDVGKDVSLRLRYDDDKYYDVNSMTDVRYDDRNEELIDSNGIEADVGSNTIIVKVILDDKGNTKLSDDEYRVEYFKGHDALKYLRYDYVIVIKDSAKKTNNTKYIILFEKVESEEILGGVITEAIFYNSGGLQLSVNEEDFLPLDERDTSEEIVNKLMNNAAPESGEKNLVILYSIRWDRADEEDKIVVKDIVFEHGFNLQTENYIYVKKINERGSTAIVDHPENGEEKIYTSDYDEYLRFVLDLEMDYDDETMMSYLPIYFEIVENPKLKDYDRIFIDEEKEFFIIIRGMEERGFVPDDDGVDEVL